MRKEQISESQAYLLIIVFIIGTSLAISSYSASLQNTWISTILAIGFATPVVLIYAGILNTHPGKDLFQILDLLFGKIIGRFIGFLYTFYFIHLGALCIRNITEYIQVVSFPETPQYFTAIFLGILAIYIVKSSLEVVARVNKFLFPLLILILFVTFVLVIPNANVNNLLPILENGWLPVIKASFLPFSFPFGETVIFLTLLNTVEEKKKNTKIFLLGIYGGGFFILTTTLRNILILGFPFLSSSTFPSYQALSLINIGNFVRGIEIIVSILITIAGFIKISVCLLAACIGICRIFNFSDYKWVSAPIALLMMSLSFILFNSTMHMFEWVKIYKYYAFPFQVILPIIIFVVGIIKKNKSSSTT